MATSSFEMGTFCNNGGSIRSMGYAKKVKCGSLLRASWSSQIWRNTISPRQTSGYHVTLHNEGDTRAPGTRLNQRQWRAHTASSSVSIHGCPKTSILGTTHGHRASSCPKSLNTTSGSNEDKMHREC